jgi:hypothetical protein
MITDMKLRSGAWLLAGAALLILACSDAPIVPVQPTNRVVLAEMVGQLF